LVTYNFAKLTFLVEIVFILVYLSVLLDSPQTVLLFLMVWQMMYTLSCHWEEVKN